MPIYEYECKACGHRLEKLQKMSAEPLADCPACKHDTLSRLISAAGFRLAGGGWYETDFKTGSKRIWPLTAPVIKRLQRQLANRRKRVVRRPEQAAP